MSTDDPRTLSIIVPVYNEAGHLARLVEHLLASPCPIRREWIFVDDGSRDESRQVLRQLAAKHPIQVVEQPCNSGKGAAIVAGLERATGDFVLIQDADFEYDPRDIPALLRPLLDGRADVVYGSRFKKSALQVHRTYHYFVNRFLTILSNLLSGIYLTDMETCYKIFRADLIKAMRIQSRRFGIEVELTAYVAKTRARIFELPINYYPRTRLQGKKIGWRDGVAALRHLVHFNWLVGPERAFHRLPAAYHPASPRTTPLPEPAPGIASA